MKFANPNDEVALARDEECLREFLAGNKTAFAQAFWENGRPHAASEGVAELTRQPEAAAESKELGSRSCSS